MRRAYVTTIAWVTVLAAATFLYVGTHALVYAPDSELSVPPSALAAAAPASSTPVRLQIPSLHIDAHVQHVGVNAAGNLQVPNNSIDVGWYKHGVAPGYLGSAVIDGHVDNGLALPGVFRRLRDIQVGDDVYVITEGGTRLRFVVTGVGSYPYKSAPSHIIFGRDESARLNLITCNGSWVPGEQTYSERLVVFTILSES